MATEQAAGQGQLEQELAELLEVEEFDPPDEFREQAHWNDDSVYEEAARDPEAWWARHATELLDWFEEPGQALDDSDPPLYKWFADGKLNASHNCLDRHVEAGRGDRVAFHWRGEEGEEREVTYDDLHRDVQRFANALKDHGIQKGEVVGIFLPMIPEVVVAMLACARIGAPHNVVFGGFSVDSVKERMEFSDAKALITVDGARRKGKTDPIKQQVDEVMADVESIQTIFVVKHTDADCEMQDGRDVWYHEALEAADAECDPEPLEADSDVWWCSADVGWVTGHSYIVYGPLLNGATGVMYEGAPDYPDKDIWWELCERYGVTLFYTAPTAIRACIKWGAEYPQRHDLSKLRLLGTVGEPINPKAWLWYHKVIGGERCPIVDTWWQTETGHILISPLPGMTPTKPGSATIPLPGVDAAVFDDEGNECDV